MATADLTGGRVSDTIGAVLPPSSRGLGHRPFKAATGIRIPLGAFVVAINHGLCDKEGQLLLQKLSLFAVVENYRKSLIIATKSHPKPLAQCPDG